MDSEHRDFPQSLAEAGFGTKATVFWDCRTRGKWLSQRLQACASMMPRRLNGVSCSPACISLGLVPRRQPATETTKDAEERHFFLSKELGRMMMEADKFQDLQSVRWRHWRPDGLVPVQKPAGSIPRESWCFGLSLKAGKKQYPSSKAVTQEKFPLTCRRVNLFVLVRHSTDWTRPTHVRKGNLLHSSYLVKCSSHLETPPQTYPNNVWPNIWASYGPIKLTHKTNHYIYV